MKHSKIIIFLFALLLLLTACGNDISTQDYINVVTENKELKEQVDTLSAENQALSAENESLSADLLEAQSKNEEHASVMSSAETFAMFFGVDSLCLIDDNNRCLQIIAGNTYPISNEGINNLWADFLSSLNALSLLENSISCEKISISFFDPSGVHILDISLNTDSDSNFLDSITCNILYIDTIAACLKELNN